MCLFLVAMSKQDIDFNGSVIIIGGVKYEVFFISYPTNVIGTWAVL